MSNNFSDTAKWMDVLHAAERAFAKAYSEEPASLFPVMHHSAARVTSVDACYVCLYHRHNQTLLFSYTFDAGKIYIDPLAKSLDDGPTSWVVLHNKPLLLPGEGGSALVSGISFGDPSKRSCSALYIPMRAFSANGAEEVVGVFSVQSYEADAYTAQTVAILQEMADRAGRLIQHDKDVSDWRARTTTAEERLPRLQEEFVQILRQITAEAEALFGLMAEKNVISDPADYALLEAAVYQFRRNCYRGQTHIRQVAQDLPAQEPSGLASEDMTEPSRSLSNRELEILVLLRSGASNRAIASQLHISADTVKFHCGNIYGKLGVNNRVQAVQEAEAQSLLTKLPNVAGKNRRTG